MWPPWCQTEIVTRTVTPKNYTSGTTTWPSCITIATRTTGLGSLRWLTVLLNNTNYHISEFFAIFAFFFMITFITHIFEYVLNWRNISNRKNWLTQIKILQIVPIFAKFSNIWYMYQHWKITLLRVKLNSLFCELSWLCILLSNVCR